MHYEGTDTTPGRDSRDDEQAEKALQTIDVSALQALSRAEIDGQIATAHAFPRSVSAFLKEAKSLATLSQDTAEACIYSLPRKGKDGKTTFIVGPSIRFAEIIRYSYGNSRSGGRVVSIGDGEITGQGVFHDLEKNVMITQEVSRRITDKNGRRFNADMIQVTGNAAISIAQRNAILGGVPKAVWLPIYEAARRVAIGDGSTLVQQRERALAFFTKAGVTLPQILAKLELKGVEDIDLEQLEILAGIRTAIKDGEPADKFFGEEASEAPSASAAGLAERVQAARSGSAGNAGGGAGGSADTGAGVSGAGPIVPVVDPNAPLPDGALFKAEPKS